MALHTKLTIFTKTN